MADPAFFEDAAAFRRWLRANAASTTELIVGFYKVGTGRPSMSWPQSVDVAICFGWIDGVRKRIDDESYQIRFSPRRQSSIWSAINIARYRELEAQGRITSAGRRAFERRTEERSLVYSYEQPGVAGLSPAEERTFKGNRAAWRFWQGAPPGYRKVSLHYVTGAKKAATRAARLSKLIEASAAGQRLR